MSANDEQGYYIRGASCNHACPKHCSQLFRCKRCGKRVVPEPDSLCGDCWERRDREIDSGC